MKISARATLAVVALLIGLLASTGLSSGLTTALAQPLPTPTLPNLLGSPSPTKDPVPVPGEEEEEEEEEEKGGGTKPSGGGGTKPSGGGDGGDDGGKDGSRDGKTGSRSDGRGDNKKKNRKKNKKLDDFVTPPSSIAGRIPGAYDTSKLVATAIRLRSLGMTQEEVVAKVFPPFIIAGKASWIDTWGAPRYGPAPGQIRTHEGQDVFCDYGDPILAPEAGTITMNDGGLGGITARVHRADGKYWYMTHLSALNRAFRNGDRVQVGDVVGYCGNSGNAATTPPHVHFGFYNSGGVKATNPMKYLVKWLRLAENRVLGSSGTTGVIAKATRKRQRQAPVLTAARRFGDAFAPDRSDFRIAGESLWASGTSPASGAFGLAEAALQEALSTNGTELGILPTPLDLQLPQSQGQATLEPGTMLAQILAEATHNTHSHTEGTD